MTHSKRILNFFLFSFFLATSLGSLTAEATWSSWTSLGGGGLVSSAPSACSWDRNNTDVFAIGRNGQVLHKHWNRNSGWENDWRDLGGVATSPPQAVCWRRGEVTVYARGTDGNLWGRPFSDQTGWQDWVNTALPVPNRPAVLAWNRNRLDVASRGSGSDSNIYHIFWANGRWQSWRNLGGSATGDPGLSSWGPGRIDVFSRASDGSLQHIWFNRNGGWNSSWENLGGFLAPEDAPDAASWKVGRVDVFVRGGSDNGLYRKFFEPTIGSWSGYEYNEGGVAAAPAASTLESGSLDVFEFATDGNIYTKRWTE